VQYTVCFQVGAGTRGIDYGRVIMMACIMIMMYEGYSKKTGTDSQDTNISPKLVRTNVKHQRLSLHRGRDPYCSWPRSTSLLMASPCGLSYSCPFESILAYRSGYCSSCVWTATSIRLGRIGPTETRLAPDGVRDWGPFRVLKQPSITVNVEERGNLTYQTSQNLRGSDTSSLHQLPL